jgi:uncharacterized protein (TIRG00374 family)
VSSLLVARVFDQIAISILFFISSCVVVFPTPWLRTLSWSIGGILMLAIGLLSLMLMYQEASVKCFRRLIVTFKLQRYQLIQRVLNEAEQAAHTFTYLRDKKTFLRILGYSFAIWLSIFSVNYLLLTAFGVQLSFAAIVLVSTLIIFLGMFPLQLLGGMGIRETTWVLLAMSLGISKNIAIVSGFGAHIVTTLYLFGFGLYGLWRLRNTLT